MESRDRKDMPMRMPRRKENKDWLEAKKEEVKSSMSRDQRDSTADLLTELLYLAVTCPEHLREKVLYLCEGIADLLDDEVVTKCEEYAAFRLRSKQ